MWEFFFFSKSLPSLVNCILDEIFLIKLDKRLELNKFQTLKTQLNENKIRGVKWILIKFRECNLNFLKKGKAVYDCCIALIEYVWGSVCGNWRGLWGKCKWISLKIPTEFFQLKGPVKTNERYQRRIDFVWKLEGWGGLYVRIKPTPNLS